MVILQHEEMIMSSSILTRSNGFWLIYWTPQSTLKKAPDSEIYVMAVRASFEEDMSNCDVVDEECFENDKVRRRILAFF